MGENLEEKANYKTIERKEYNYDEAFEESKKYFKGDELAASAFLSKYALKDSSKQKNDKDLANILLYEKSPLDMHHRLASEFARIENKYPNPLAHEEIFDLIDHFKYIVPQGGPMSGIGNNLQIVSLSNCFVIGNDEKSSDSYGAIMKTDQEQVQLMKRRGGVGHDLSYIRPKGMPVLNSALTSTGVVPFMERYSNSTREVAQDGRRGALMLSLSIKHPDAERFIDAKLEQGKVTGANISVKVTDEFMNAVMANSKFEQKFPITSDNPKYTKEIDANSLWNKIIHNAWKSAEPGVLFWDTILRESIPDRYSDFGFHTVSTNPCGEIPLCPYDSCRLLAINLFGYVKNPFTKNAEFDFSLYKKHVGLAQRLNDDIIDMELEKIDGILAKIDNDPENEETKYVERELWKKIKKTAIMGRRTGTGITGEGDMLAAMGLTYGTKEATEFATEVQRVLALEAYRSSVELAKERGAFEIYDPKREEDNPFIQRLREADSALYEEMVKHGRRNISMLTIAPTGTTSMMTQTTSGIEPVFLPVYERRKKINQNDVNARVDEVDDKGDKWQRFMVFHHKFEDWLKTNEYDIEKVKEIANESVFNKEKEKELQDIVSKSPYYNATANDVDWVEKVRMQGAMQKWVDHSISVTVNVPADVKEELISDIYLTAWKSGCKGATVYREGSRSGVLLTGKENAKEHFPKKRPESLDAEVLRFNNDSEKWIAFVGLYNNKPYEIFTGKTEEEVLAVPTSIKKGRIVKVKENEKPSYYNFMYTDRNGFDSTVGGISHQFNRENWNYSRMLSGMLKNEVEIINIIDVLSKLDIGSDNINSWRNGAIRSLSKYIPNGTKTEEVCETCGVQFHYEEGCKKCDCGSKCE